MIYEQSPTVGEIAKAMVEFRRSIGKIAKKSDNPFFHSKYASLSDIHDSIDIPLSDQGLSLLHFLVGEGMVATLVHVSGEWMRGEFSVSVTERNKPQAMGSGVTYFLRYSTGAILGLNIDEDDDGNAASAKKPAESIRHEYPSPRSASAKVQERYPETPMKEPKRDIRATISDLAEKTTAKGVKFTVATDTEGSDYYVFGKDDRDLLMAKVGMDGEAQITGTVEVTAKEGRSFLNLSGVAIMEGAEEVPF